MATNGAVCVNTTSHMCDTYFWCTVTLVCMCLDACRVKWGSVCRVGGDYSIPIWLSGKIKSVPVSVQFKLNAIHSQTIDQFSFQSKNFFLVFSFLCFLSSCSLLNLVIL